jgi:hypothetical protein
MSGTLYFRLRLLTLYRPARRNRRSADRKTTSLGPMPYRQDKHSLSGISSIPDDHPRTENKSQPGWSLSGGFSDA